jgi:catechol 2,3-dioxygenase-like lactoylglutathione lyase family enzyme
MDAVPFHIGIATNDLPRSMEVLSAALGIAWTEPGAGEGSFTSVDGRPHPRPLACVSLDGPIHIDLMQGAPGTLWESDAPRLHHFAYWTDDVAVDVARLESEGWTLELTLPDEDGQPSLFAYLIRADGFRLELIDRAQREAYEAGLAKLAR